MDYQAIRKEYEDQGIDEQQLLECPLQQLEAWLVLATERSPGKWFETNAMTLATSDGEGHVSSRIVLLKGITKEGIRFFTNYDSAKGRQLAQNPRCSIVLNWPHMGRQVRMAGDAERTSRETSEQYFHSRPRDSQIGAAISNQSQTLESREELQQRFATLRNDLEGQTIPLPENWGGFLIRPVEFEFWQGRSNRLHDRIVYSTQTGQPAKWRKSCLAP